MNINSRSEFQGKSNSDIIINGEDVISGNDDDMGFEGPEKNLHVIFQRTTSSTATLRGVSVEQWENMLDKAKCKVLSTKSNSQCTSFVLSESSLFVFDDRVILKTCGTTPLLLALDDIIKIGSALVPNDGMNVAAVLYWRKNFTCPEKQEYPHQSFTSEVEFLETRFGELGSSSTVRLGPLESDHWFFYYVELVGKDMFKPIQTTFELKMHEIHPEMAQNFFIENQSDENFNDLSFSNDNQKDLIKKSNSSPIEMKSLSSSSSASTSASSQTSIATTAIEANTNIKANNNDSSIGNKMVNSIRKLVPNIEHDEFFFDPCGYSMNGLTVNVNNREKERQYVTVHITPENKCSYVSFETTCDSIVKQQTCWEKKIVSMFRPVSFTTVEISPFKRTLVGKRVEGYTEICPCSMHQLNGLYISFFSYMTVEDHPMMMVSAKRIGKIVQNTIVEEFGSQFKGNDFSRFEISNTSQEIYA